MRKSIRRRGIALAGLSVLLLAGIPAGTVRAAPTRAERAGHGVLDACSVLTSDDVQAVYGGSVNGSHHGKQGAFDSCDYFTRGGFVLFQESTTALARARHDPARTAAGLFAAARKTARGRQHVKGLGRWAFWSRPARQLWVLDGDVVFSLSQIGGSQAPLPRLEKLAQRVKGHL